MTVPLRIVIQLSNSTSYEQARSAYHDVQERHQDIRKIEETFAELAQLIQDVSALTY
jgi:syntaxin 1B/2/3